MKWFSIIAFTISAIFLLFGGTLVFRAFTLDADLFPSGMIVGGIGFIILFQGILLENTKPLGS
ncbi:MAG: hypothetical protein AAF558_05815 [Verrucomicrobiota bacterium]